MSVSYREFPIVFDETQFVSFLGSLASVSKYLQNGGGLVAQETLVADMVINRLQPYITSGQIKCNKVEYVEGRANLILEYGSGEKTIAFAGSHFDVVPANPDQWKTNPFEMVRDGDKLFFRGSTDCLGHVALETLILEQLAINNVDLGYKLIVVMICDEEVGSDPEVGVMHLNKDGLLEEMKKGPVYWIDSADVVPVLACGSALAWKLKVNGKKAHTGFPLNGINPIPIAMDVTRMLCNKFNELCPLSDKDTEYNFSTHSNMKPTLWKMPEGASANQYSDWVEVIGDVRMTPFFDPYEVKVKMLEFAKSIDVHSLERWHDGFVTKCGNEESQHEASIEFQWIFGPYCGIAVDTKSDGYKMIADATLQHHPTCTGCSDLGAVPLVADMQKAGVDLQIIGYGVGSVYHGNDEYCTISGMRKGFNILKTLLERAYQ
jgi:acetylornithine deacetylase